MLKIHFLYSKDVFELSKLKFLNYEICMQIFLTKTILKFSMSNVLLDGLSFSITDYWVVYYVQLLLLNFPTLLFSPLI